MEYVVVSKSELLARAIYNFIRDYLPDDKGSYLVGIYDMDFLLYSEIDYLFFDYNYYEEYKKIISTNKFKAKKLVLVALEKEKAYYNNMPEQMQVICGDTSPEGLIKLLKSYKPKKEDLVQLEDRDRAILYLLQKGYTNKEIGKSLYLSDKTIKNNLTRIYKILGVKNKYEAIVKLNNKET